MSKEKLIPELRFPEFENSGEWQYEYGDELFEPISNKNHNSDLPILAITQEQGAIPRDLIDYHVSVSEKSVERYKVVEIGDFIISLRSFQGGIEYSNYLGLCSPAYIILRKKRDVLNDFYRHYFKSFLFIQDLNRNLEGIRDGKMISYKQFSEILIPNPRKQEQQKIASCLSSLDELIAAHKDKLDALKDHKKGLLQNLFPQEGETVPKVRFPEFEGDGEWEIKRVEDFFDVGSSKRVLQKDWTNDGVPFYRTRELVSLSKNEPFGSEIFISEDLYIELKESYGVPVEGDFLVSGVGTLGVIYQVKKEDKFYFKDGNVIWFSKREELDSSFFEFCFESSHIQNQIDAQTSKSTVGTYTIKNARITEFWHPPRIEEQQKIASCLSAVDELITAQQEKIDELQQHKKGLMQGLFPKIES